MAIEDKYKKNIGIDKHDNDTDDENGGAATSGGQAGQIEFRDFLAAGERFRDDLLPPDQKRRLLSIHGRDHAQRVRDQKAKRDYREQVKNGKVPLQVYRQTTSAGMNERYKIHFLAQTAQFGSGVTDSKVNPVGNENNAETNNEKRKELQLNYDLTHKLENVNQPTFTPTPKLTRQ